MFKPAEYAPLVREAAQTLEAAALKGFEFRFPMSDELGGLAYMMEEAPPNPVLIPPDYTELRMRYAGAIGLLCRQHIHLDGHPDEQESIRQAVSDWCELTGWEMVQTISRLEVFPPEI
jgi:hypothetical protein